MVTIGNLSTGHNPVAVSFVLVNLIAIVLVIVAVVVFAVAVVFSRDLLHITVNNANNKNEYNNNNTHTHTLTENTSPKKTKHTTKNAQCKTYRCIGMCLECRRTLYTDLHSVTI